MTWKKKNLFKIARGSPQRIEDNRTTSTAGVFATPRKICLNKNGSERAGKFSWGAETPAVYVQQKKPSFGKYER